MQLRTSLRLNTAVEAMTHVIIPALDPDNGPAHEQAALVVGMLTNAIDWLPYEHAFDRAELSSNREALAQTSDATEQTAALIDLADDVLLRSSASPGDVLDCVRALRYALANQVDSTFENGTPAERTAVSRAVLDAAARETPLVRAAYLGHGFEGPTTGVAPLADQLVRTGGK